MGKRGPKPLPTALKKQRGTLRPHRQAPKELQPPLETPNQPRWLDKEAKAEWNRVVPVLDKLRVLTAVDYAMLADYCSSHSIAVAATIQVQKEGMMVKIGLYMRKHPLLKVGMEARAQAMRLGCEFGLSPASRTRVSMQAEKEPDPKDTSENFLFGSPKLVAG